MTIIPLGLPLPAGSSHLPARVGRNTLVRPRPKARLFGVAPGGGYRVSRPRSGLRLLVSVALFLALGRIAAACCVRPLAVTLSCGVRTFLSHPKGWQRSPDLLCWGKS
jgi:hypothetical protein